MDRQTLTSQHQKIDTMHDLQSNKQPQRIARSNQILIHPPRQLAWEVQTCRIMQVCDFSREFNSTDLEVPLIADKDEGDGDDINNR